MTRLSAAIWAKTQPVLVFPRKVQHQAIQLSEYQYSTMLYSEASSARRASHGPLRDVPGLPASSLGRRSVEGCCGDERPLMPMGDRQCDRALVSDGVPVGRGQGLQGKFRAGGLLRRLLSRHGAADHVRAAQNGLRHRPGPVVDRLGSFLQDVEDRVCPRSYAAPLARHVRRQLLRRRDRGTVLGFRTEERPDRWTVQPRSAGGR